jgi:hypothetical protein
MALLIWLRSLGGDARARGGARATREKNKNMIRGLARAYN